MTSPINKRCSLLLILFAFSLTAVAGDSLPSADDVNVLSKKAQQISNSFFSQTFTIRMQHEYSGRFLNPQDKDTLCETAQQASAELEQIAIDQNTLKDKIENYKEDDWETLFGQTGLWRKLAADFEKTKASKLEIDTYFTITDGGKTECPPFAIRSRCAAIKASMGKIRCFGPSEPNELEDIARSLAKSDCYDDPEMLLSLAILQSKYAPAAIQTTLSRSPQTITALGKIILADISSGSDINSLNPFTAELAAFSAWQTEPSAYKELLLSIADTDKLKSCWTLYAAATAIFKSDPAKTIKLLMESDTLQYQQKGYLPDISAETSARLTAQYAYDYFTQHSIDCNLAVAAFDNYSGQAQDKMTEQMQYLYGTLLYDCDRIQQSFEVLGRLSIRSNTIWSEKANLELLKMKMNSGSEEILSQLRTFILNSAGSEAAKTQLRREAMTVYCQAMLSRKGENSAMQVLGLLDTVEQTPGLQYDLFKAQAFSHLGRLEESARYMSKAIVEDSNSSAALACQIASEIIDKIELWQKDACDFNELLQNCITLAEFAHKSENNRQTALLSAEASILAGKNGQELFLPADENDPRDPGLRVQARLLMAQDKFDRSAAQWTKIEWLYINASPRNYKSYGWWQAKFYELDCLANIPQPDKRNIRHAIEVLQNSYADIPRPWAEKLDLLKRQCSAN
jgi:hypothetical protein